MKDSYKRPWDSVDSASLSVICLISEFHEQPGLSPGFASESNEMALSTSQKMLLDFCGLFSLL